MSDAPADQDAAMTAEEVFTADARALGYLPDDPHQPGDGRGLAAYYRDVGVLSPTALARIRRRERVGWHLPGEDR